jgi:hypothetical protein
MVSSSDIGTQLSTQFLLKMLRGQLNETQRQIGSGKKSATLANMGTLGASNSIAYRNKVSVLKGYTDNLNAGKAKFSVMDKSLGLMTNDAREVMTPSAQPAARHDAAGGNRQQSGQWYAVKCPVTT